MVSLPVDALRELEAGDRAHYGGQLLGLLGRELGLAFFVHCSVDDTLCCWRL
jgi:hypothetical protein